jgi:acyl carrier protein
MIPRAIDSLDLVKAVMLVAEVFGTELPGNDPEMFGD